MNKWSDVNPALVYLIGLGACFVSIFIVSAINPPVIIGLIMVFGSGILAQAAYIRTKLRRK